MEAESSSVVGGSELKKRDDILEGMVSGKETQMLFCTNEIASTHLRYEITLRVLQYEISEY